MAGLGETTARLATLRRGVRRHPGRSTAGLLSETEVFGANPGQLRLLSYAPDALPPKAPLVVVLHGCTQSAEDHAVQGGWLALADRCGFAVLAPEQTSANNSNRCFNWFQPQDATRGQGEAASIAQMVSHLVSDRGLDPERVFVTGLSAGGAMTSVMLAAYPELFAGGGIIAGLPFGAADNMQQALTAMYQGPQHAPPALGKRARDAAPPPLRRPRVMVWHGDADATVSSRNGAAAALQWAAVHGLAEGGETQVLAGRSRTRWRAGKSLMVELNVVHGLGHGTPLATKGKDGVGVPGPYMLEAGVSAASELLRFWEIAEPAEAVRRDSLSNTATERAHPPTPPPPSSSVGAGVMRSLGTLTPGAVQEQIEKSLRKAGLM